MIDLENLKGRWVDLSSRALFRVTGPDRVRYLNGQVTNDVSGPLHQRSVAACLCTLKGKVEALVWISADEDSLLIDGQIEQREEILQRLDRYLIADDCEIEDLTGQSKLIHHFDPERGGIESHRSHATGFDLWLAPTASNDFPENMELTSKEFAELQLLSLIPEAPFEISGNEFPAELGLDTWAVDFEKGCYLGQEIISRIKSVGRVKRHLTLVIADTSLDRFASLRNSKNQGGIATRPSIPAEEKKHVSLALFSESELKSQTTVSQIVTELSATPPNGAKRSS